MRTNTLTRRRRSNKCHLDRKPRPGESSLHRRASWRILLEVRTVDRVHLWEHARIREVDASTDDVRVIHAGSAEQLPGVLQDRFRLRGDISSDGRVIADVSGHEAG